MLTILQLAKNTFKECMREPVYFLMLLTALVMIGLFPTFAMFVFRKQIKLVVDSAMATTMLFSLFVEVLCAGHTISREMKNGTVLLLLSKPVTRFAFILSKVLGILLAVSIFVLICNCATVVSVVIATDQFQLDYTAMALYFGIILVAAVFGAARNFLDQASFSSHAVGALTILMPVYTVIIYTIRYFAMLKHGDGTLDPEEFLAMTQLLPALLLQFPAVWAMGAITVALATRLEFVSNLLVCLGIFLVGLVSKYFVGQWLGEGTLASFLTVLLPNWQYFWMADAIAGQRVIPMSYVFTSALYVMVYVLIWTIWAFVLFRDRELAKDSR